LNGGPLVTDVQLNNPAWLIHKEGALERLV